MGDSNVEIMRWFASQGIGCALAGLMFVFYRRDQAAHLVTAREARDVADTYAKQLDVFRQAALDQNRLLMDLLRSNAESNQRLSMALDANTAAVTWLLRQDHGDRH